MKGLYRAIDLIEKGCLGVAIAVTFGMMCLIAGDALLRYVFNQPILGAYEMTEDYLMQALVFLGLSYTFKKGRHVRVEVFVRTLQPRITRPLDAVLRAAGCVFCALLAYGAWGQFLRAVEINEFSNSILRYPMAPAYFIVVLGCSLFAVRLFQSVLNPSIVGHSEEVEITPSVAPPTTA